jgi:hypothetical protein
VLLNANLGGACTEFVLPDRSAVTAKIAVSLMGANFRQFGMTLAFGRSITSVVNDILSKLSAGSLHPIKHIHELAAPSVKAPATV